MAQDDGKIAPIDLDMSLDDIEDLPGFAVLPSGAYRVSLTEGIVEKMINDHPALECQMKLEEIIEVTEAPSDNMDDKPPLVGDIATVSWMRDNKYGVDSLKKFLKPLGEKMGTKTISQIIKQTQGLQLIVIMHRRFDAKKDRYYGKVKKLTVL